MRVARPTSTKQQARGERVERARVAHLGGRRPDGRAPDVLDDVVRRDAGRLGNQQDATPTRGLVHMPSAGGGGRHLRGKPVALGRDLCPQERDQLVGRLLRREARRLAVAAAASLRAITLTSTLVVRGPQAHLADSLPLRLQLLAHERSDERAVERADVVDDPLREALVRAVRPRSPRAGCRRPSGGRRRSAGCG